MVPPSRINSTNLKLLSFGKQDKQDTQMNKEVTMLRLGAPLDKENKSGITLLKFGPTMQTGQSGGPQFKMPGVQLEKEEPEVACPPTPRGPCRPSEEMTKKKREIVKLESNLKLFESKLMKQSNRPTIFLSHKEPCVNLNALHNLPTKPTLRLSQAEPSSQVPPPVGWETPRRQVPKLFRQRHVIDIDGIMEDFDREDASYHKSGSCDDKQSETKDDLLVSNDDTLVTVLEVNIEEVASSRKEYSRKASKNGISFEEPISNASKDAHHSKVSNRASGSISEDDNFDLNRKDSCIKEAPATTLEDEADLGSIKEDISSINKSFSMDDIQESADKSREESTSIILIMTRMTFVQMKKNHRTVKGQQPSWERVSLR
jgi:hypothetical protein